MATDYPTIPAVYNGRSVVPRNVFKSGTPEFAPSLATVSGTKSRDPGNDDVAVLRAGLVMGKITSGGKYAPAILGLTGGALTSTGTTLTTSGAIGTEINRRIGATGTFKLIGPPTAAGTVRTVTVTYSAVNTTTGDVTITATGVNEVQTLNFTNSPAGTFRLGVVDSSGVVQYTQRITYSGTAATLVSNINTALDAVLASGVVVASGSAVTAIAITFSGAGYTGLPQTLVVVDTDALTAGDVDVTRTTTGVDGRFVTSSIIAPTDGSETPLQVLTPQYGTEVTDQSGTSQDATMRLLRVADFDTTQIVNYPADASLKTWLKNAIRAYGLYTFSDDR